MNYSVPEKEKEIESKAEKFTITAAAKKIQCYSWGEGPVVMVMHGWAGRATQFRKFIPALNKEGFRVVGFDGPSHGQSEGTKTNIIEFEEAFKNLYAKVGEPVAILAHSFGGGAVLYAAVNGLRVPKLINIASPTIGDEIINTYLRAINGTPSTGAFFKSYMLKTYGRSFDEYTSSHLILKLTQEMDLLLVHDEDDKEVGLEHPLELKRVYPKAQLFITKGLGHTRILKDENVIKACVTFIKTGRL